jgi:hypothetical protein
MLTNHIPSCQEKALKPKVKKYEKLDAGPSFSALR